MESFTFYFVPSNEIKHEILIHNKKKGSRGVDIPTTKKSNIPWKTSFFVQCPVNILKDVIDTYLPTLTNIINSSTEQNEVPNNLKLSDVPPIFKKKHPVTKENQRHVNLLLVAKLEAYGCKI